MIDKNIIKEMLINAYILFINILGLINFIFILYEIITKNYNIKYPLIGFIFAIVFNVLVYTNYKNDRSKEKVDKGRI